MPLKYNSHKVPTWGWGLVLHILCGSTRLKNIRVTCFEGWDKQMFLNYYLISRIPQNASTQRHGQPAPYHQREGYLRINSSFNFKRVKSRLYEPTIIYFDTALYFSTAPMATTRKRPSLRLGHRGLGVVRGVKKRFSHTDILTIDAGLLTCQSLQPRSCRFFTLNRVCPIQAWFLPKS